MTSKRATKLKSSIRKEMAKANGLEVRSSRGKGDAKLPFQSPQAGVNLRLLKLASRGIPPSMPKLEDLARNVCVSWWLS
jgi:hypothetical protein